MNLFVRDIDVFLFFFFLFLGAQYVFGPLILTSEKYFLPSVFGILIQTQCIHVYRFIFMPSFVHSSLCIVFAFAS